jgi:hypothetical protein
MLGEFLAADGLHHRFDERLEDVSLQLTARLFCQKNKMLALLRIFLVKPTLLRYT